jgi:hypothetical protein
MELQIAPLQLIHGKPAAPQQGQARHGRGHQLMGQVEAPDGDRRRRARGQRG